MRKAPLIAAAVPVALAMAAPAVAADAFRATLTGAAEVPGPGDADGRGSAQVTVEDGKNTVCYTLKVDDIATPTAAHIHRGAAGSAGPPVVTLSAPTAGTSNGCATAAADLVAAIRQTPEAFYVNVHNAEHPAGAVRGQLGR
jgi:hypothetical protein